jgi:hypothetical protein
MSLSTTTLNQGKFTQDAANFTGNELIYTSLPVLQPLYWERQEAKDG